MSQPSWIGYSLNDRYRIDEVIGKGGMSVVFKATDPNLKRVVAVKMIHSHHTDDPEFVRRFESEAAAVAKLRHPNIIQVYDFDSDDENYYMVLEFVPGESLLEHLKRLAESGRQLDLERVVQIGASVAEAVDYAHRKGMIHRDIKPANVMLNIHGEAILTDFGITKIVGETRHTATGAVIGTALYMSPEQIRGEGYDHRVDIYALGVMLFEMVAGRPPFEAESAMTIMMMHLNDPVPNLKEINPEVPDSLKRVIEKALAKDPDDRYSSGAEVAEDLRGVLMAEPQEAPAPEGRVKEEPVQDTLIETVSPGAAKGEEAPSERAAAIPSGRTAAEGTPPPRPPEPPSERAREGRSPLLSRVGIGCLALAAIGGLAAIVGGIILATNFLGGDDVAAASEEQTTTVGTGAGAGEGEATSTPTPEPPTATLEPTLTPTITLTPTATVPPGFYVRINDIYIDNGDYVVEYETFEYTETLPGMHVHFFFDTVPPDQAGAPGSGPWILYGGPRPFREYRVNQRPSGAEQMCALVANPDHSVIADTGNCYDLPES